MKRQKMYWKRKPVAVNSNTVALSADGYIMSITDGTYWIQVRSTKLRKAVKEAFGFEDWQVVI